MGILDRVRDTVAGLLPQAQPQSTQLIPVANQAPAPRGARAGALTAELGTTGTKHVGGVIVEEWLPQLYGERGIRTWREMSENDPTVGAVLFAIEMLIRQVEWSVEPANEEESEKEKADFLWGCMNDLDKPWVNTVAEILTMLPYGWSIHELVYKVRRGPVGKTSSKHDDGLIGWKRIPLRGQDTLLQWVINNETEDVEAFIQVHPVTFKRIEIPAAKFVHFKTREKRGPEGISVLRSAYRPWLFKKRLEEIEAIGLERDLAGLPVASVPPELLVSTASTSQQALLTEIKKIVRGIKVNEQMGVVFPLEYDQNGNQRYKLELLSAGGSGAAARAKGTDTAIKRYNQAIAQTVLGDFVLLGHDKVGSFALASSKTEIFAAAMGAWLDTIADTLNEQAVPRLFTLNGIGGPYPRIVHGDIETPDLDALSNYILRLANAGAITVPDEKLERHLRRAASLPEQDEGEA
jgi:hypothetical protein